MQVNQRLETIMEEDENETASEEGNTSDREERSDGSSGLTVPRLSFSSSDEDILGNGSECLPDQRFSGEVEPDQTTNRMHFIPPYVDPLDDREVIEIFADEDSAEAEMLLTRDVSLVSQLGENRLVTMVSLGTNCYGRALLDSGAEKSLIPDSFLYENHIMFERVDDTTVQGFGHHNLSKVKGKVSLPVTVHGIAMETCEFLVLDSNHLGGLIILGVDFLRENCINLSLKDRRISKTWDSGMRWDCNVTETGSALATLWSRVPCYASETRTVEPNKTEAISVKWNLPVTEDFKTGFIHQSGSNLLIFDEEQEENYLQVFCGLVNGSTEESKLLVTSNSRKSETIKEGDQLGIVSTVVHAEMLQSSGEVNVVSVDPNGNNGEEKKATSSDYQVKLEDHLTESQQEAIRSLLGRNQSAFGTGECVGKLDVEPHQITLTDYTPVYQRARRFPEVVNQEIEKQCRELELLDVIEPSKSGWSSPIVPVRKKDGSIRLCVDYRRLNFVTARSVPFA